MQNETYAKSFTITLTRQGHELTCVIIPEEIQEGDKFSFALKHDGKVLESTRLIDRNTWSWSITESGLYWAEGRMIRGALAERKFSNTIQFFDDETIAEFERICSSYEHELKPLYLYQCAYPYQDFCMFFGKDFQNEKKRRLEFVGKDENIFFTDFDRIGEYDCYLLSTRSVLEKDGVRFTFSGMTRNEKRLIFGDKDLMEKDVDIHSVKENIGESFLITREKDNIELSTDYFGNCKIYYYQDGDCFLVSSSMHLLLIALKRLGVRFSLNKDKVLAEFCDFSMLFQQNFSKEMSIKNIFVKRVDQRIVFSESGAAFEYTSLHHELCVPEEYNEQRYEELLYEAKREVVDNIRVALEHPSFKHVRIDLSGGLDSRMVYSAATNLPDPQGKICVNTYVSRRSGEENMGIACALNNLYGHPYDTIPEVVERQSLDDQKGNPHSSYLGSYFDYSPLVNRRIMKDTLRLNGGYGEICTRPYASNQYLSTSVDNGDMETLISAITSAKVYLTVYWGGVTSLKRIVTDELESIPGRVPLEKQEFHYLFYGNGMHFGDRWKTEVRCPGISMLQSKVLFHLKNMTYLQFKSRKLALDFVRILNPLLAAVPYANAQYTQDISNLGRSLHKFGAPAPEFVLNKDKSKLEEAETVKKANLTFKQGKEAYGKIAAEHMEARSNDFYVFAALRKIVEFDGDLKELCCSVYAWLKRFGAHGAHAAYKQMLINRVFSLYYQICFIDGNRS